MINDDSVPSDVDYLSENFDNQLDSPVRNRNIVDSPTNDVAVTETRSSGTSCIQCLRGPSFVLVLGCGLLLVGVCICALTFQEIWADSVFRIVLIGPVFITVGAILITKSCLRRYRERASNSVPSGDDSQPNRNSTQENNVAPLRSDASLTMNVLRNQTFPPPYELAVDETSLPRIVPPSSIASINATLENGAKQPNSALFLNVNGNNGQHKVTFTLESENVSISSSGNRSPSTQSQTFSDTTVTPFTVNIGDNNTTVIITSCDDSLFPPENNSLTPTMISRNGGHHINGGVAASEPSRIISLITTTTTTSLNKGSPPFSNAHQQQHRSTPHHQYIVPPSSFSTSSPPSSRSHEKNNLLTLESSFMTNESDLSDNNTSSQQPIDSPPSYETFLRLTNAEQRIKGRIVRGNDVEDSGQSSRLLNATHRSVDENLLNNDFATVTADDKEKNSSDIQNFHSSQMDEDDGMRGAVELHRRVGHSSRYRLSSDETSSRRITHRSRSDSSLFASRVKQI